MLKLDKHYPPPPAPKKLFGGLNFESEIILGSNLLMLMQEFCIFFISVSNLTLFDLSRYSPPPLKLEVGGEQTYFPILNCKDKRDLKKKFKF